jgi:CRISPR-associated protein Cas6
VKIEASPEGGAQMGPTVNLYFPVLGTTLPTDHGYALYGALARALPPLHEAEARVLVGPILGRYVGDKTLQVEPKWSNLRLRLPAEDIGKVLPLAGKALEVDGHKIRVGVPRVMALEPAPTLMARVVLIKGFKEPEPFLEAVRRQLNALGTSAEASIPLVQGGPQQGKPRRHVVTVKGQRLVGFTVALTGLQPKQSIAVQERGLGGKHRMGCGFFVPVKKVRG